MAGITTEQQARLQAEVQQELERREWAEPGDNVMAEYITVLLANGSTQEKVQAEMDDLVGSDFDPYFLDWLFTKATDITTPAPRPISASPTLPAHQAPPPQSSSSRNATSRLIDNALAPLGLQPEKRKFDSNGIDPSRKRLSDGLPSGPRAMGGAGAAEGRSLADRIQPGGRGRGSMQVRGMAGPRGGPQGNGMGMGMGGGMGFQQPGFRPMMQPGFTPPFFQPGQQEMMAQMMMMQASMAQMGEMMAKMAEERDAPQQPLQAVRPGRPSPPVKVPHGTKLGGHSVSVVPPKASTPGPIPDKPTSKALCRYSVGCSNARCQYSHPSPAADEKTGMVLSDEPCEAGKGCKDAECTKSHVSPAAVLGNDAGPSRLLCKYQNCSNPSCAFRHEDENGNPIPPPALTAAKAAKNKPLPSKPVEKVDMSVNPSSDNEDGDMEVVMTHKGLMDGALDDSKPEVSCRYGERCTRPDCKFSHPATRPAPKSANRFPSKKTAPANGPVNGASMNKSKKFGVAAEVKKEVKLDASAGEFKPEAVVKEKALEVSS